MAVGASSMKGHVIGPWLEARTAYLISRWLPDWICSHAQLTDGNDFTMQSRSWDIVVHRPIPTDMGYPSPSHPPHGYSLVPKQACCAVVNVKGNFSPSQLRAAMKEPAYSAGGDSNTSQMDYLGCEIPKIYFCFTSYAAASQMHEAAEQCGVQAFTLAQLDNRETDTNGKKVYRWTLQKTESGELPLWLFRKQMETLAERWTELNGTDSEHAGGHVRR